MTRRRWIADHAAGDRAALTGANALHLARVLRARPGQEFEIAARGRVRLGRVLSVSEERVEFELGDEVEGNAALPLCLYLAVFKFDRMEWALEKATELGVERVVPVVARRTEVHLAKAAAKRVERWRRLAREAAQQSRRAAPPEVSDPLPFRSIIAPSSGLRIVLAETGNNPSLAQLLRHPEGSEGAALEATAISLAVGPEGGWTSDELAAVTAAGWLPASLGPRILRAETAAIAALAIVSGLLET